MPPVTERADIVVIGAGVIGLACARELLRAGREVLVLEAKQICAGASWGNCGLVTPSHSLPLTRPKMMRQVLRLLLREDAPVRVKPRLEPSFLAWGLRFAARCSQAGMLESMRGRGALLERSRGLFDEWMADGLDCEWEAKGVLEVFATEATRHHSEGVADLLSDHGVESEVVTAKELTRREPALRDGLIGGRLFPRDAQLRPDRLVHELARQVRAAGGEIREGCAVEALGKGELRVAAGTIEARTTVVAVGAIAPKLLRGVRLKAPIQPGKGYSITMGRPDPCPNVPLLLAEANMAVTPWPSGLRLGGTMELAGYDETLNRARVEALRIGANRFLRSIEGADPVEWWGWRPMTPDELPIIDQPRPGLVLAIGHGMMGVSMAPATAELVVSLVTGSEQTVDAQPYRLSRF